MSMLADCAVRIIPPQRLALRSRLGLRATPPLLALLPLLCFPLILEGSPTDPLDTLPSSSSYFDMYPKPGLSNLGAGTFDKVDPSRKYVPDNDGLVWHISGKDVLNAAAPYDLGLSGGVTALRPTPDGYAASAGKSIIFYDDNFQPTGQSIDLSTSDIRSFDTAFYLNSAANVQGLNYALFTLTDEGVGRLTNTDGDVSNLIPGDYSALEIVEFEEGSEMANPVLQVDRDFLNLDNNGSTFGQSVNVNFNNPVAMNGALYHQGGADIIVDGGAFMHPEIAFQQDITYSVPEPASVAVLLLGGAFLSKRRRWKMG